MAPMFFYMENNKIDSSKVNQYLSEKYSGINLNRQYMSEAFEQKKILTSKNEICRFLIYLGYSKEGIKYYFEQDLASELYYEVFMILSRCDLINYLNTEEL